MLRCHGRRCKSRNKEVGTGGGGIEGGVGLGGQPRTDPAGPCELCEGSQHRVFSRRVRQLDLPFRKIALM